MGAKENREQLKQVQEQIEDLMKAAGTSVIDVPKQVAIDHILETTGFMEQIKSITQCIEEKTKSVEESKAKLEDLKAHADIEDSKYSKRAAEVKTNPAKVNAIKAHCEKLTKAVEEKVSELANDKEKLNQLKTDLKDLLINGPFGLEMLAHVDNIVNQSKIIGKAIPDINTMAAKASLEPTGAVVVTPAGPGSVTTNLLQIAGTIGRLKSQISALSAPVNSILDSSIKLGIDPMYLGPLPDLAKVIGIVASIPI